MDSQAASILGEITKDTLMYIDFTNENHLPPPLLLIPAAFGVCNIVSHMATSIVMGFEKSKKSTQ